MQDTNASTPPPAPVAPPTTSESSATTTAGSAVTMTIAKYKDMILETIDQLRQRKARPDLERISHMLQRKHGISFRETEAILGKLVDSQVVFKVDYKGSTSYRNAAKWRINHLASSGSIGGLTQNSDQVKQKLREAVRALAVGCGNNSSNSNNSVNNNTSSNSSGNASGGSRKGRPQPNNDGGNSGTHAAASGDKKSNSTTPTDALNNVDAEASTAGTTIKKGNSTGRVDEASTHAHANSSESKNSNSKSPASGNATPGASAAIPPTNQTPTSKRSGSKKEYTGPVGITLKDLENWLTKQDSENLLVKNLLVTALQREVHAGWLKRLRNGNYIDVASIASNSKKRSGNNKGNAKNTSSSSGATVSSAIASTTVTSTPSSVSSTVSLPSESSTAKGNTKPTTTTTTTNTTNHNNNIIVFTNGANSTPNNATLITTSTCTSSPTIYSSSSPPTNTSFAPQPPKPNHGTKRSASAASLNSFQAASQQLISSSTPNLLPTSDVTPQGQQHGATLVLFPSSSPTTSAGHPALLLPVSSTQAPNDSGDRRTALLTTTSSTAASPFPSSSSSPSSVYSPSGSTYHNNNALARVSLSSTSTTQTSTAAAAAAAAAATGTPCLSRESAPAARRDNNNTKPAKSAAPQPAGPTSAPVPVKRGRPASRRKRFKKTPGPEFETEDILKSVPEKCVTCCLTAQANKHGEPEDLLVCKDCNTTVHPSCLDYCEELAVKARNSPWQCIECRTCYVCDDSGDGDSMLFCDACDKGYHMKCHVPGVAQKPKGKWVCGQCVSENENAVEQPMEFEASNSEGSRASSPSATGIHLEPMEASGPSCLPTPCDSPVQPDPEEKEIGREDTSISLPMLRDFQGPYPDAANWTIDDVVNFFKSAGFVSQAEAFREQEIDGKSLLLMKRSDVLTGLSLKLGPALKMYTHVQNLQLVGQSSFVSGIGH